MEVTSNHVFSGIITDFSDFSDFSDFYHLGVLDLTKKPHN